MKYYSVFVFLTCLLFLSLLDEQLLLGLEGRALLVTSIPQCKTEYRVSIPFIKRLLHVDKIFRLN